MKEDVREEALTVLAELAALAPEIRLGQLMAHLGFLGEDQVERSLWDIEDDELLAVLHRHRSELLARLKGIGQGDHPASEMASRQTSSGGI
jgi:hypothetical protein